MFSIIIIIIIKLLYQTKDFSMFIELSVPQNVESMYK